jgi:hypothetical protein
MQDMRKPAEQPMMREPWELFEQAWANWLAWSAIGLVGAAIILVVGMSISLLALELLALLGPA